MTAGQGHDWLMGLGDLLLWAFRAAAEQTDGEQPETGETKRRRSLPLRELCVPSALNKARLSGLSERFIGTR